MVEKKKNNGKKTVGIPYTLLRSEQKTPYLGGVFLTNSLDLISSPNFTSPESKNYDFDTF